MAASGQRATRVLLNGVIGLVNVALYFQRRYFGTEVQAASVRDAGFASEACPQTQVVVDATTAE